MSRLTSLGACSLIAMQGGSCLRGELQRSSGDVFSSLECTQSVREQEGAEGFLDSFKICKNMTLVHVSSLSQNPQALESPCQ